MPQYITKRGPFTAGPLSLWRFESIGTAIPRGTALPKRPEIFDDDETPAPTIERNGRVVTIHFHGIAGFKIDFSCNTITGFGFEPGTADFVIQHILDDHLAPRLMAEQGKLVLHASGVRLGDAAAVFLGETGAGKSTLAASLHQAGHQLLGDDAVIVAPRAGGFTAQPVYPSLRLYPEVISKVLDEAATTSPMAYHSDKVHVSLASLPERAGAPLPLTAIFFLADHGADGDVAPQPQVIPLDRTLACIKMVEQSFTLDPHDRRCAARRLAALSKLAIAVPAFTLSYPRDFARLDAVKQMIETTMQSVAPDPQQNHREDYEI